jgi:hypothetical protein
MLLLPIPLYSYSGINEIPSLMSAMEMGSAFFFIF